MWVPRRVVPDQSSREAWVRMASALLRRSLGLRRGQRVAVDSMADTVRTTEVLSSVALRLGIHPVTLYSPDRYFQGSGSPDSAQPMRAELSVVATCQGYVYIPPSRDGQHERRYRQQTTSGRREHERLAREWMHSVAAFRVPAVYLLTGAVTESAAKRYGVDFRRWQRESLRASSVKPGVFVRAGRPLARRLQQGRTLRIQHPNGTDLELRLAGRRPVLDDGVVDREDVVHGRGWTTLPSGFLTVALDERVARGRFVANRPTRSREGTIQGLDWSFRNGRLTHWEASHGGAFFSERFRTGGPERRKPGLFEVGLNPEIRDFPLAEDQELGVVCVAIGHNDDFGGRTRGEYRNYALLRGASVLIDGVPVLRAGRLS
jgi:leucyl aminopeptidase (aminopeptidase T)